MFVNYINFFKIHKMNKGDLINKVAEDANLTKAQATEALAAVTNTISDSLAAGDKVTLIGFGTFSVTARPERNGRNPQTGSTIVIPAKKVVKFKPGKELSATVDK